MEGVDIVKQTFDSAVYGSQVGQEASEGLRCVESLGCQGEDASDAGGEAKRVHGESIVSRAMGEAMSAIRDEKDTGGFRC